MLLPTRADWVRSAVGAGLAMAVFAGYLALRGGAGLPTAAGHWDQVLAVGLLAGNGIVCALWLVRVRYHQTFQTLTRFLSDYRQNPASAPDRLHGPLPDGGADLRQFTRALDGLCSSYRQALS